MKSPVILVSPLDWGLGHATRCIPIIHALLAEGAQVHIAASGSSLVLLKETFTELPTHEIPGYAIQYRTAFANLDIIFQLPRIRRAIQAEHRWLQRFLDQHAIDGIISDNRYGLWHENIANVIISHQLSPRTPLGTQKLAKRMVTRHLNRFDQVW
ncbi:MAG: glycosyl transferase family 28, partial [Flavobacteriales bacterium]|nr:glycosyl transferase family 28 [Flavobacteriales bacterium]